MTANVLRTPTRVLVVDDEWDPAETVRCAFRQLGCLVRVAHSGIEAIEIAYQFRPRLVVVDTLMPGMDGYETATELKKQAWSDAAVFIAHTVSCDAVVSKIVKNLGFDHHVPKPGDVDTFEAILINMRSDGAANARRRAPKSRSLHGPPHSAAR